MTKSIYDARNISMMMDLYELTMANGYFLQENAQKRVAFDVFFRRNPDGGGFSIFAGLEQILEYIENMHFAEEDIEAWMNIETGPNAYLYGEDVLIW